MERLQVMISGRVQGVFFRAYTQKKALELGLTGFVRNLPDGRVEALAEGPKEKLQSFLDWCRKGSPPSKVDSVEAHWEEATKQFRSFDISP